MHLQCPNCRNPITVDDQFVATYGGVTCPNCRTPIPLRPPQAVPPPQPVPRPPAAPPAQHRPAAPPPTPGFQGGHHPGHPAPASAPQPAALTQPGGAKSPVLLAVLGLVAVGVLVGGTVLVTKAMSGSDDASPDPNAVTQATADVPSTPVSTSGNDGDSSSSNTPRPTVTNTSTPMTPEAERQQLLSEIQQLQTEVTTLEVERNAVDRDLKDLTDSAR